MEKRKRPAIFELADRYVERMFEDLTRIPTPFVEAVTERLRNEVADIEERLEDIEEWLKTPLEEMTGGGPFIYGFSYTKEPGREPQIREFGNIRPSYKGIEFIYQDGTREPLTDVIEEKGAYIITVELPGVENEDVKVSVVGNSLDIRTEGEKRFSKWITLEKPVKTETAKADYKNGVLSITIEKKEEEEMSISLKRKKRR